MRCRKKPIVVDSYQHKLIKSYKDLGDDAPDWFKAGVEDETIILIGGVARVVTPEGEVLTASFDDYIMRGVQGELYICRKDIYEATYEELGE